MQIQPQILVQITSSSYAEELENNTIFILGYVRFG